MVTQPTVQIYPTLEDLQAAAAEQVATVTDTVGRAEGRVLLAISGGTALPGVFGRLAQEPLRSRVPWDQINLMWCDERIVPFDSPESNYRLARETLLDHVPIPSIQVYPVATYYGLVYAAEVYHHQVAALLAAHNGRIDLALLGMGADGHVASLFPGFPQLDAPPDVWALPVEGAPKPPPNRVTLSPAALNRAALALFVVAGAEKAPMVRAALRGPYNPRRIPAQIVRPPNGAVMWMLDQEAAREL